MSGLPYYRFYSKDTWSVATNLLYCNLIGCAFKNNVKPFPYDTDGSGKLYGAGSVQNYYPYPSYALSSTSINTVKVRAVMVASPVFDDSKIATFIKSVFRKSYYMTNPPDPDLWPTAGYGGDFQPQQMWVPIRKESIKSVTDLDDYNTSITVLTQRGVYDTIIGAKEYFVNNPYGWSKKSAEYYLTMFPDN
jgi:hypothetical protein